MNLDVLPGGFAICRLARADDAPSPHASGVPWFLAVTTDEVALVCPSADVPPQALAIEDDWTMLRVAGPLDFELVGIIARLAGALAQAGIPVFVASTYLTDYFLVKTQRLHDALTALRAAGVEVASSCGSRD